VAGRAAEPRSGAGDLLTTSDARHVDTQDGRPPLPAPLLRRRRAALPGVRPPGGEPASATVSGVAFVLVLSSEARRPEAGGVRHGRSGLAAVAGRASSTRELRRTAGSAAAALPDPPLAPPPDPPRMASIASRRLSAPCEPPVGAVPGRQGGGAGVSSGDVASRGTSIPAAAVLPRRGVPSCSARTCAAYASARACLDCGRSALEGVSSNAAVHSNASQNRWIAANAPVMRT
jgi:hypothetical protein